MVARECGVLMAKLNFKEQGYAFPSYAARPKGSGIEFEIFRGDDKKGARWFVQVAPLDFGHRKVPKLIDLGTAATVAEGKRICQAYWDRLTVSG